MAGPPYPVRSLVADDRAIEGLPVRLVIAIVVGVASLGVMMNMLSGIGAIATEELDVKPAPEVIPPEATTVRLTVVDSAGEPVADATVVVTGASATLPGVRTATTGSDGSANVSVDPSLGPNQDRGTLAIHVKPPAGSRYADDRENTAILVVDADP